MKILIVNGPNLNLLGKREPHIYGSTTFEGYLSQLQAQYPDVKLDYFQSNIEGELVSAIHAAGYGDKANLNDSVSEKLSAPYDGIILNAGAYTHTSVALYDALHAIPTPVIEVHISNVAKREDFRSNNYISPAAAGTIMGFGLDGYRLALEGLMSRKG